MSRKIAALSLFIFAFLGLAVLTAQAEDNRYRLSEEVAFSANGTDYHERVCVIDTNGDARVTAADARTLLRASARLETLPGPDEDYDADGDGRITAADARLVLRISAHLETMYATADGKLPVGVIAADDGKLRDFDGNGSLADGSGYHGYDLYLFEKGAPVTNRTVGDFTYGANGVATTRLINENTLQWQLRQILKKNGDSYRDVYRYMGSFTYAVKPNDTQANLCMTMLKTGRGSCYHYAALTKALLDEAGYETYLVPGKSMHGDDGDHQWVLVKVDGAWRHMDAQYSVYRNVEPILMTDALAKSRGYRWNAAGLPAAE